MSLNSTIRTKRNQEGAALLAVLGVIMILTLIVGSFAFESKLDAMLVSHKRKRFYAETMARSGIEYARAILDQQQQARELEIEDMGEDQDGFLQSALYVKRGLTTTSNIEMDSGRFSATI
jgi:type II secretory pathway component PulK